MLTVIDEYMRECLAIHVQRSLKHDDVLAVLTDLFTQHAPPEYIQSDNGSEFTAIAVREWLEKVKVQTLYIRHTSFVGRPFSCSLSIAIICSSLKRDRFIIASFVKEDSTENGGSLGEKVKLS